MKENHSVLHKWKEHGLPENSYLKENCTDKMNCIIVSSGILKVQRGVWVSYCMLEILQSLPQSLEDTSSLCGAHGTCCSPSSYYSIEMSLSSFGYSVRHVGDKVHSELLLITLLHLSVKTVLLSPN